MTSVDEAAWLTERFEEQRPRLRAVAYRMLGSASEADDAVQEAWLRVSRADTREVDNLAAWLTTVVARVCLNMLRRRLAGGRSRWRAPARAGDHQPAEGGDPEEEAVLADSVGLALLVVLDTLTPAERLAFVLHDMFAVPFDEIAPMLEPLPGRGPAAGQPGPAAGDRRRRRRRTPTWPGSAGWSTRSWPRPGTGTSRRWSRCCTPTWCCRPTGRRPHARTPVVLRGARQVARARGRSPGGCARSPSRRWSTAPSGW